MERKPMPLAPAADDSQSASREIRRLIAVIKRAIFNWQPSAAIVALGLVIGVTVALTKKPTYKSETIILYRQGVRFGEEGGQRILSLGTRLSEMLLARNRLEKLLDELAIYQDVKQKGGYVEAVEEFRKDIVWDARATDTFSISFKGKDPKLVQKVTERLADSLIEENQRLRIEQARVQSEFIGAEKARAEADLKAKEVEIARFLADHPEFALDENGFGKEGASIRAQAAAEKEGDPALHALQRQAARNRALLSGATPPPAAGGPPVDPELEAKRAQAQQMLTQAQAELAENKARYTEQHPDVIAAQSRVAAAQSMLTKVEGEIAQAAASRGAEPAASPDQARERMKNELKRIEAEIAQRKAKQDQPPAEANETVSRVVNLETEWARLNRAVTEARERMGEMERNFFRAQVEASSELGGYSDQVVVLDPAFVPTRPEKPGKALIVVLAAAASIAIALMVAIVRALLDDRIYEEVDLQRVAPVLAVVPRPERRRWWKKGS
jgi:uncharacterized protein involved in exopolysaccharide biosynthesis